MKKFVMCSVAVCAAAVGLSAWAAELKSGLEPGEAPGAFHVLDVTGPSKGDSLCYRCQYGGRPVVSIFTRNIDENVTKLIKEIDASVAANEDKQMRAFVVLLTDDPDAAEPKLAEIAEKNKIEHVPLTIFDGKVGPPDYKLAEDADLTVLMWVKSNVKVNKAFSEGKFGKDSVKSIVTETEKILN